MTLARRGFLGILAGVIAGPSIVKASSLMAIRVTDVQHLVRISGVDQFGKPIEEYIRVIESLKDGLDMGGYNTATELIRPRFRQVNDIIWTKGLIGPTSLLDKYDARIEDGQFGRVYSSRTNVYQPDAPPLDSFSAMRMCRQYEEVNPLASVNPLPDPSSIF